MASLAVLQIVLHRLYMSVTNSAFLAMPVDHTYLLGQVLLAQVHNWPDMTGMVASRHCTYTAVVCFAAVQSQILDRCRCCAWGMCSVLYRALILL